MSHTHKGKPQNEVSFKRNTKHLLMKHLNASGNH
jgi:hypothetical protein